MRRVAFAVRVAGSVMLGSVALLVTRSAHAAPPNCSSLPNPVYVEIDRSLEPLMKRLGKSLRQSQVNPMTVVYVTANACSTLDAMQSGTKITTNPQYIPASAEDPAWDDTLPAPQCIIDPSGVPLDFAGYANFRESCAAGRTPVPTGLGELAGPISPAVFVVPKASTQTSITVEQAYFVLGYGAAGQAEPWTDETLVFSPSAFSSLGVSLGPQLHVPSPQWKAVPGSEQQTIDAVDSSRSPEETLGILSASAYQTQTDKLDALAFQTFDQRYAYWPDSTATKRDKQNVRDGHYTLWTRMHFMAPVDAQSNITNPRARYIVELVRSQTVMPAPDFDPFAMVASMGFVPECAMKVTRSIEGGDLSLLPPNEPCGCGFVASVQAAPAGCVQCLDPSGCSGTQQCRHGYCEAN